VTAAALKPSTERKVRVIFADDSAIVRGFMRRWVEDDHRIELIKACGDGLQAVTEAAAHHPNVIILDTDMPGMDGLATLPHLRRVAPRARIVMASAHTPEGRAAAMKALGAGACDIIAKPEASAIGSVEVFHRELIEKIVALGEPHTNARRASIRLRPAPQTCCPGSLLVVAAASGGHAALQSFLVPIARRINAPILIVQHMPSPFTALLAERLEETTGRHCREARDNDTLTPGVMLIAPGDYHMRVARCPAGRMVHLDRGAPVQFRRPAADVLFESAAAAFGPRVVGVVLTGIGADGCEGSAKVAAAGGRVIVQDEASSLVWGMPGAVALAGYAEAVKPLKDLSTLALRMMNGEAA
jgi:two-component system, chemotaxis family, protein-glutamate methylesterase/glutaminase